MADDTKFIKISSKLRNDASKYKIMLAKIPDNIGLWMSFGNWTFVIFD